MPVDQHFASHMFLAGRRLVCVFSFGICERETYNMSGLAYWLLPVVYMAEYLNDQNTNVQVVVMLFVLPLLAAAYIMGQFIVSPLHFILLILLFFAYKKITWYRSTVKRI